MTLIGKIIISGHIRTITGLHIGGSKSSYEIGGVDLNVVKSANGQPYIPGSSLKGKLRSMLGKKEGSTDVTRDSDNIKEMFGAFSKSSDPKQFPTRLFVRDALLNVEKFGETYPDPQMAMAYSDIKFENKIDRKTTAAEGGSGLRQLERVPENCYFKFEMVYNLHDDCLKDAKILNNHLNSLALAMQLLQDDYLGGQGSRGYGKISFEDVEINTRSFSGYQYVKKSPDLLKPHIDAFETSLKKLSEKSEK